MKSKKRGKSPTPALQSRLAELEDMATEKGVQIHYDLLEAAGLKLKGGICVIRGEYHIFVDKRKNERELLAGFKIVPGFNKSAAATYIFDDALHELILGKIIDGFIIPTPRMFP